MAEILAIAMFALACIGLMGGYSVAFTLSGVSLIFAALGVATGTFEAEFLLSLPGRIYPLITREILMAVPLFVFMGVMLEKSRIAEDLLEAMGDLFGPLKGGLGVSVVFVGALLAASTGIVGATVVTMGLLSLPTMLKRNYAPSLASGSIAASGTLGQIIPPSIVLVILGDQMSNAYQEAQRSFGLEATGVVSVGDLFAGALLPGLILVALYALYISITAILKPSMAPAQDWPEGVSPWAFIRKTLIAMLPPIFLIIAVLGSILSGYATPTRGAALGALGAILLAAYRIAPTTLGRRAALLAAIGLILLVVINLTGVDMRFDQNDWTGSERIAVSLALALAGMAIIGTGFSMLPLISNKQLGDVSRTTMHITCMVFVILIGATVFTLIFRGFGGDELVGELLSAAPGGKWGALALVMLVMFILGFFLDFIEITFVVVPLVAPPLLATGMDPIWLGVLMALNLQTSFLTPPFGFALFYLRGVAPPEVTTTALYRGVLPFIMIQLFVILLVIFIPSMATKLPAIMLN
ncbi:TRAP transporter large permease [Hellea balneolensis]|uniref:TRAP transporter large permease n=1 Tax=Hellea balneolensis TaxID=287478 RepID=UPI0004015729|nr:TRAP transporter large permease subunit [Hellea balneolensis]